MLNAYAKDWWNSVNSSHGGRKAIITQIEVKHKKKTIESWIEPAMTVTNFMELILAVKISWSDVCCTVLYVVRPIYIHQSKLWPESDFDCHSNHHLTTILFNIILNYKRKLFGYCPRTKEWFSLMTFEPQMYTFGIED